MTKIVYATPNKIKKNPSTNPIVPLIPKRNSSSVNTIMTGTSKSYDLLLHNKWYKKGSKAQDG